MKNEKGSKKSRKGDPKSKRPPPKFKKNNYQKTEIVFDAEARQKHLTGFSARKRERRAFGLAMQKVKDRKYRLESRQSEREARREQVELAEKHKQEMMQAALDDGDDRSTMNDVDEDANVNVDRAIELVDMYQDKQTQSIWGGEVVVKVSTRLPGESDDEDDERPRKPRAKKADEQQEFAGKVERYLPQVKASLPGKKKHATQQRKTKGMHGAANMKGMASNAGDFKLAQKALSRASNKKPSSRGGGSSKKRR